MDNSSRLISHHKIHFLTATIDKWRRHDWQMAPPRLTNGALRDQYDEDADRLMDKRQSESSGLTEKTNTPETNADSDNFDWLEDF
jgi:hypothetical protein